MKKLFQGLVAVLASMVVCSGVQCSCGYAENMETKLMSYDQYSLDIPVDWKIEDDDEDIVAAYKESIENLAITSIPLEVIGTSSREDEQDLLERLTKDWDQGVIIEDYLDSFEIINNKIIYLSSCLQDGVLREMAFLVDGDKCLILMYVNFTEITREQARTNLLMYLLSLKKKDELLLFPVQSAGGINLEKASDEELDAEISKLQNEKIIRAKKEVSASGLQEDGSFTFRGVPWYSTREETENILGVSSLWSKGPGTIYRMSAIKYDHVTMGTDRVDDFGGCTVSYSGITIAGLKPSSTHICYIYPIVNGEIVKDDNLSQIYFGYYKFSSGDFGDHQSIYKELKRKLNTTYGTGKQTADNYHTVCVWKDKSGNSIQLLINSSNDYVALGYIAADADERLDEMLVAIEQEKIKKEEMEREMNEGNMEGL